MAHTVGDYGAHGHGFVAHQPTQALQRSGLHLVVGHAAVAIAELLDMAVQVGIGKREAKLAALRSVETHGRYGVAAHHIVAAYDVDEMRIGVDHVRLGPQWIPAHGVAEGVFEVKVGHLIAAGIVIEHTVETYGFLGDYGGAQFQFGLQGARCADAHHMERAVLGAYLACGEVYVGQGVELVDHDVDVVGADAVAQTHDRLALIGASDGVEFAR